MLPFFSLMRNKKQMMKQLQMETIPAKEVIIKLEKSQLVFKKPQVQSFNLMGQKMFCIIGNPYKEVYKEAVVDEKDIDIIIAQTGATREAAQSALKETGDLAKAILKLQQGK